MSLREGNARNDAGDSDGLYWGRRDEKAGNTAFCTGGNNMRNCGGDEDALFWGREPEAGNTAYVIENVCNGGMDRDALFGAASFRSNYELERGDYNKSKNYSVYDYILSGTRVVCEKVVEGCDVMKMEEGIADRARVMAAFQRLRSLDYENGTWL